MKTVIRRFFFGIGIAVVVFAFLNYQYVWVQIRFALSPRPAPLQDVQQPDRLSIESLGIAAPVVYPSGADERVFQEALQRGVVHYPGTALPGQPGNTYIFGHSSDFVFKPGDYKTVFALLPKIQIGATIVLTDHAGTAYAYRVTGTAVVSPSDTAWLHQGSGTGSRLTLQTSYPVGTALKRFLVIAELAEP